MLKENGGSFELTKNWAKSILYRMGFVKRRGITISKVSVLHFEALKTPFLFDLKAVEIPPELTINWDLAGIKNCELCQFCSGQWSKRVEVVEVDDKWQYLLLPLLESSCLSKSCIKARYKLVCMPSVF